MENRDVLNEKLKVLEEKEQSPAVSICGILYYVISIGATIPYDAKDDIKEQEFLLKQQWIQETNILPQTATWVQLEPTEDLQYQKECWFCYKFAHFRSLVLQINALFEML